MSSYAARTREMFRKYGKVAVGVHFAVYFTGLGGKRVDRKREEGGESFRKRERESERAREREREVGSRGALSSRSRSHFVPSCRR